MEPIRTTKTAQLRRLKMYREDLNQFIGLFQNSCANVTISDGTNRYESLDEMKEHVGSTISRLDVRGEKPSIHFLLDRKEQIPGYPTPAVFNELRTEEISDAADMLFFKLREFLAKRERRSIRLPMLISAIVALVGTYWFAVRNQYLTPQGESAIHPNGGLFLCVIALVISIGWAVYVPNRLTLETKLASQSFWSRNREAFATHAVTSAISVLIGYVLGHFLK